MTAEIIELAGSRPVPAEERLAVVASLARAGLGRGEDVAREHLLALAYALADLLPEEDSR
jgi:hypothetical protein